MDVYVLADPRDGMIRYVGVSNDWRRRVAGHRLLPSQQRRMPNQRLCDWKDELLAQGVSFDAFQIGAGLTLAEAQAMEKGYISTFRESEEPLLNIQGGGSLGRQSKLGYKGHKLSMAISQEAERLLRLMAGNLSISKSAVLEIAVRDMAMAEEVQ